MAEAHAPGDGVAVQHRAVAGGRLEGVSERVAVVQQLALPALERIALDDADLRRRRAAHHRSQRRRIAAEQAVEIGLDAGEQVEIEQGRHLDRLDQPRTQLRRAAGSPSSRLSATTSSG